MKRMFCLAVLVGCAPGVTAPPTGPDPAPNATPDGYTKLNESPRPMKARAPETVTIYRTKAPAADYVEVSELVDHGSDEAGALDQLKLSAAGVGCDGLVVGASRADSVAKRFGGGTEVFSVAITGTCIMFSQDPGTWRPSAIDARCAADRDRLFAAKDPDEKLAIARSMPPDCHRR